MSKRVREQAWNQSTDIPNRGQHLNARRVFQKRRVCSTDESVCKRCSSGRIFQAEAAIASRSESSTARLQEKDGADAAIRAEFREKFAESAESFPFVHQLA